MKMKKRLFVFRKLKQTARRNNNFRKMLFGGHDMQMGVMKLNPLESIDFETHQVADQMIMVVQGSAKVSQKSATGTIRSVLISQGDVCVIACGTEHRVTNKSQRTDMRFITIYSEPIHRRSSFTVRRQH